MYICARSQELAQDWVRDLSLLLDDGCGSEVTGNCTCHFCQVSVRRTVGKVDFFGECGIQRWNLFLGIHSLHGSLGLKVISNCACYFRQHLGKVDNIRCWWYGFLKLISQRADKPRTLLCVAPWKISCKTTNVNSARINTEHMPPPFWPYLVF